MIKIIFSLFFISPLLLYFASCTSNVKTEVTTINRDSLIFGTRDTIGPLNKISNKDSLIDSLNVNKTTLGTIQKSNSIFIPIDTNTVKIEDIVRFAETLVGIPYKYGSTNPANGFDCSGFITYVYNHFNIKVPRSSIDFTNVGREVKLENAKRGDIILFTGTDSTRRIVGHMGIVTENKDILKFIHSTSGQAFSVQISSFSPSYQKRFMKVINLFE